jgi:hypothetical protein
VIKKSSIATPHRFHIEWDVCDDSGSLHDDDGQMLEDRRTVIEEYLTALSGMRAGYGYVDGEHASATASVRFDAPVKGL